MNKSINIVLPNAVTKLSCSNVGASLKFYADVLGFELDDRYTINKNGGFGAGSYVQLYMTGVDNLVIGLFKDIDQPFPAFDVNTPPDGTAPTFVVASLAEAKSYLQGKKVTVGENIESTSDKGFRDRIAFFPDPDNNVLAIRQNLEAASC